MRVRYTGSQSKNMRLKQGQKTTDRLVIHKTLQEEIKAVDTLRQTDTEGREQRLNTLGRKGNQTEVYHREGRVITGAGNMDRRWDISFSKSEFDNRQKWGHFKVFFLFVCFFYHLKGDYRKSRYSSFHSPVQILILTVSMCSDQLGLISSITNTDVKSFLYKLQCKCNNLVNWTLTAAAPPYRKSVKQKPVEVGEDNTGLFKGLKFKTGEKLSVKLTILCWTSLIFVAQS